jgi:hypothetical protein
MRATLAVDGGRAYVAFALDGRARLAIAVLDPGAAWWNRRLPGRGGASGAPAVLRSGGSTFVAYTQRQRHGRGDVFLATEGPDPVRVPTPDAYSCRRARAVCRGRRRRPALRRLVARRRAARAGQGGAPAPALMAPLRC